MFEFDRVVCINLARRPERWASFQQQVDSIDWPFGAVERFEAIDGKRCPPPRWFGAGEGGWGAAMSHLAIIQDTLSQGLESVLIFEDDAELAEDFATRARTFFEVLPNDWDGVYLGGEDMLPPEKTPFGNEQTLVMRSRRTIRSHAYGLRSRYLLAAYRTLTATVDWARWDRLHFDQRLARLHAHPELFIYEPSPWLVGQRMGEGDVTSRWRQTTEFWEDQRMARRQPYL